MQLNTFDQFIIFMFDASKQQIPQIHETIALACPKDDNKENINIDKAPKLSKVNDLLQFFKSFVQFCDGNTIIGDELFIKSLL